MHNFSDYPRRLLITTSLTFSFLGLTTVSACNFSKSHSDIKDAAQTPVEVLVSSHLIASLDKAMLTQKLNGSGITALNGVRIYQVSYNTLSFDHTPIRASGIVLIPDSGASSYPWISLQHATLTKKADAPSMNPREGLADSSQGFVTVVADYLGYGDSAQIYHPYILENGYSAPGIDILRAARELTETQNINLTTLFLKGYSEGGYATASLQKALESLGTNEFSIRASSASAGPLDVEKTGVLVVQAASIDPANIPFLILAYDHWLTGDSMPLSSIFVPSIEAVTHALDGRYTSTEIAQQLPTTTRVLFKESFVNDFISATPILPEAVQLHQLLKSQSLLTNWAPKSPTRIYHCIDDEEVPVAVTIEATAIYKAAGAPVESVLIPSPDPSKPYTHGTCPAIFAPLAWFRQILAQDQALAMSKTSAKTP
ncbi:MAG: hypothetical protein H7249_14205 [Chitinophagaceae bacterium]|nr:hypothetical protein [Oligoflexus sp.]